MEKDGIRFPTRHLIEEGDHRAAGKTERFIRSRTTVVYKDFTFFTVETDQRIER